MSEVKGVEDSLSLTLDLPDMEDIVEEDIGAPSTSDIGEAFLEGVNSPTEYHMQTNEQTHLDLCEHCEEFCDPSCDTSPIIGADFIHPYDKIIKEEKSDRTTTGIIRIMRANGNNEAADLLEEIRGTAHSLSKRMDELSELHRRRTGSYPQVDRMANKNSDDKNSE